MAIILVATVLASSFIRAYAFPTVISDNNHNGGSSSSTTCTLNGVNQYDKVLVLIISSGNVAAVNPVVDSSSNSYSSVASTSLATGTLPGYALIYGATASTVPARGSTLTVTVTFAATSYNMVECMDSSGYGLTASATQSASGQLSSASTSSTSCQVTINAVAFKCFKGVSVPALTTTAGDLIVSLGVAYTCGIASSFGTMFTSDPSDMLAQLTFGGSSTTTTTACNGATDFSQYAFGAISGQGHCDFIGCEPFFTGQQNLGWSGGISSIQNYTGIMSQNLITSANTVDWVELAIDLPATTHVGIGTTTATSTTTVSGSTTFYSGGIVTSSAATVTFVNTAAQITDFNTLMPHVALVNPSVLESDSLTPITNLANQILSEAQSLFAKTSAAHLMKQQDCLGVATNVNNATFTNSGPVCGAEVVQGLTLVVACNFFQLQCWAIPLVYLGMYDAFFISAALAFRFSEKGFLYFTLAGLTLGSLTEISLGIMTPAVPVMLVVVNVAYSFRLDRLITSRGSSAQ